ncbi:MULTISPECIES: fimbrial protein [unclassified Burkholderia]|uniref:fimbrial protein n=1 Tax=unclassified Burkholderia TaxID=2613784 RepID=UPI0009E77C5E|nr:MULTISPECIES: fimbrial protein [unclassified Burkholderia]
MLKTTLHLIILMLCGIFVSLGCVGNAYADDYNISLPGKLTIKSRGAQGEIFAAGKGNINYLYSPKNNVSLIGDLHYSGENINYQGAPLGVWDTNIRGVGVAYAVVGVHSTCGFAGSSQCRFVEYDPDDIEVLILLVRTGDVGFGSANPGGIELVGDNSYRQYNFRANDVEIVPPTCQIQTKNISVQMGTNISTSTFNGVGSASTPQEFWAKMTCPAGIPNLSYQIDPAGGSSVVGDPKNGILSLSNAGGASGVGVQITNFDDGSTPVGLQERRSFGSLYNPDQGGDVSIGWKARYIQTDSNVKGGEADAQATITLSYQ